MSIKELQNYTFTSKYARYREEDKRRETWDESVERVKNMHLQRYPQISEEIIWAFEESRKKTVLGSQRALQFGGKPILKKHARIYNCISSYCDRARFFQECFWLLLCGCGTGFSVQKHHVAKLPKFSENLDGDKTQKVYVIPDTIEGWADSLGVLISSYMSGGTFPKWEGYEVVFDYSLIRKEGEKLKSSSGKAPGPKPLKKALENVRKVLDACVNDGMEKMRPIDAYDIIMYASDAVLSGGVRRSATICLFSPDDMEMARAKTGNWQHENKQRGRSNNSALLVRGETTKEQFETLMGFVREYGEPGFVWADSTELVVNPCVEIGMYPVDVTTGESGWQACNLCEINGKKCKSEEEFAVAAKAAAIIGTCQAGYTDLKYLGETSKRILEREALLGVSITGMMDSPDVLFDPELQKKMAKLILDVNEEIAEKIGINPCARATCVKPAGTTSCILGTASGIHPHHAKRYIRRSQANHLETPLEYFKKHNACAVETSVWNENGTDKLVSFCIEVPKGAKTKNDIDAISLLKHVRLTQENWVEAGTRPERCVMPWLRHNVSNTISVKNDEWEGVIDYIYDHRNSFAGVALMSISGDKDYPQAPFVAIHTPAEMVKTYGSGSIMASGLIVDGLHAFGDNLWKACDAVLGFGVPLEEQKPEQPSEETISLETSKKYDADMVNFEAKEEWARRANQFAERYFDGDIKNMTYCLKDVANFHLWCTLNREFKEVDYTQMIEELDETKISDTIACAGGKCDLTYS